MKNKHFQPELKIPMRIMLEINDIFFYLFLLKEQFRQRFWDNKNWERYWGLSYEK